MSGEIRIIANENLGLARLVAALTELPEELPDFVVIGGGAVGIRCNGLDRETQDLDSLAIEADRLIEVLVSSGAQQQRAYQVLTQSGVPLDVMAVHGTGGFKSTPQVNQAFELARLWAFETAPAEALVFMHRNEQGEWSGQTTQLRVATVPSLLALKAVSMADRVNSAHPEKLYSDISDVCALIATSGVPDAVDGLKQAPLTLRDWVACELVHRFVDDRRHTEARLRIAKFRVPPDRIDDVALTGQLVIA